MQDTLFAGIFARGDVAAQVDARAWLTAMLDFERALAGACGRAGLIPQAAARAIASACVPENFDTSALGREAALSAQPAVPLVKALRESVPPDAARWVHHGATSQDVLDTAAMLVAHRALGPILADAERTADALAQLAARHSRTPMMGRTLLQHALPTTFGLTAAGWMVSLDEARSGLLEIRARRLAVALGGPVGALEAYGEHAPDMVAELARELGLAEPVLPWHSNRVRVAELAGALGTLAGAAGKLARDVTLLAQHEVAEVRERAETGRGGSSSMAHKQNPVAAVSAVACSIRTPGLVATVLAAMPGELQRAAGAWQAEWETLSELLRLTGASLAWTAELVDRLVLDTDRMRANLGDAPVDIGPAEALVRRTLTARAGA
jgi:3-carboxy-cis,cis-muconate cycloisomerase